MPSVTRRRAIILLTLSLAVVGLILLAVPFVSSLTPTDYAKEKAKYRIDISSIPLNGVVEVEWHRNRVVLVKSPELSAFFLPFWDGIYRLPDLTWERALVPCASMSFEKGMIACTDQDLPDWWRENARWDYRGQSKSQWIPNLETAPFRVEGKYVVLSLGYK
jgi:hypothetical protein